MATPNPVQTEVNPGISSAATSPGTMTALGDVGTSAIPPPDLSSLVTDPSTLQATPGWDSFQQSIDTSGTPSAGTGGTTDFLSGLAGAFGGSTATSPTNTGAGTSGSGLSSWLTNFLTGSPSAGGLSGLGPYAAVGALGMAQAKGTQAENQKLVAQLAALGGPDTAAGKQLLQQFQAGQLTPQQQQVVTTSQQQGQDLMNAAAPLSAIAQQAYQNYQSGTLPAADEQRLKQQVTQQQQQIRQQLASQGITDSSILAGYDQQIQSQADITRQQLLDARFATGNQAYDRWLSTTQAGQQLKLQGQEFAVQSLDTMLNQSLGLTSTGMAPVAQSIQLAIQSDTQLSQQVSDLIGNLSAAYAYQASGGGRAAGVGGGGMVGGGAGGSANMLQSILGGAKTAYQGYSALAGAGAGVDMGALAASESGALADIGATAGATEAATAGDIAASNAAWLGSSAAGGEAAGAGAGAAAGSEAAGAGAAEAGGAGAGTGLGAAAGAAGALAFGAAALGGTIYEFANMGSTDMTGAMQYADVANSVKMGQQQTQQLNADLASGKAYKDPATGKLMVNGVDASVYYPLANKTPDQIAALNDPLYQQFVVGEGINFAPGTTGHAYRGNVSHSAQKV